MPTSHVLEDPLRLGSLRTLAILDTAPEGEYDDLAGLASVLCGGPIAAVNFVDEERHYTKAITGLPGAQGGSVPNSLSMCAATVCEPDGVLVVEDTHADPRWREHPLVTAGPRVGFYAGVAIMSDDHRVGVVCAFGDEPRPVTAQQLDGLQMLARQAAAHLQLRRRNLELRNLAETDPLTGLGNRRALQGDLARAVTLASPQALTLVAVFDLNGFKRYNDMFGHNAGDALLARLGRRLMEPLGVHSRAYRLGGDEFCILAEDVGSRGQALVAQASAALTDAGEEFAISASYGTAMIPAEAQTAESALALADDRMYAFKDNGRPSARHQSRDVLLAILREHTPELGDQTDDVQTLARAVASGLGLSAAEVEMVGDTATLHDIGKVGMPRAILDKPGPLDEQEWALMRRHTVIGQRIVSAAPALGAVADAVRATHERWDGGGYPDGTAGASIPMAARVVAVCDAFAAMTSQRPNSEARSPAEAVEELRRCAGEQFDPAVVDRFALVIAGGRAAVGD